MRRIRWTATVSREGSIDIERRVIRAYPHDAWVVRDHYERQGYTVLQVEKGDYRVEARKAAQRPTGAQPNIAAVREAAAFLGLKLPIEVKVVGHKGGAYGRHRARYNDRTGAWKHVITVKSWLTREHMGETLWHELAHAMQFERDALVPGDVFATCENWRTAYNDGTAYSRKPYEVEARSYEHHNAEIALAR